MSEMREILENMDQEIHLKDYIKILQKRFWTIIAFFIIVVSLVSLNVSRQVPLYEARARLQIDRENPRVLNIQDVVQSERGYYGDDYYQTQYELLKSRSLAREVIERLGLASDPVFNPSIAPEEEPAEPGLIQKAKAFISPKKEEDKDTANVDPLSPESEKEAYAIRLINKFLGMVQINPLKNTRLVDIRSVSTSPKLAADLSNALAVAFIERNQRIRLKTTSQATDWLFEQIEEARRKVEESEMALQRYKEQYDIVSLENKQNLVVQKMSELSTALTAAKTERITIETRYDQMKKMAEDKAMIDSLPEVLGNSLIQQLKREQSQMQNELSELSRTYTPKHPKIIRLKSQIESNKERLKAEVYKITNSIENEYKVALAKERSLQEAVEQQKKEVQSLNQKSIQYGALEREVENNQHICNLLLARAKETGLAEGLQAGNIRIIDKAETPLSPFAPKKFRSLILAIMVGMLGGVGLAFFLEYLDDSVKDPDDLEQYVKLPFLAAVPVIKLKNRKISKELVAEKDSRSAYAEAYRSARTSIIFSSPDSKPSTILVTSPGPGDGKTLTATNLAVTMAQAGKRTLILDADLRKPRVHTIFNIDNKFGLTNLLTESTDMKTGLHKTPIANLAAMPSGPIPPNPSELLGSKRMKKFLEALQKSFDNIIIDSPPTISVTDANILSTMVDGVVLVIKSGRTSRKIIKRAKNRLEEVQGRIMGVVLNAVNIRKSRYYYSPHYYYSYYGDSRRKKSKGGRRAN